MKNEELFKVYNTSFDTVEKIIDIFFQGDFRYLNLHKEIVVSGFIDNKAICIEQENVKINVPEKPRMIIKGPQKDIKQAAIELLENNGFEINGFEIQIRGGIVDILASKENRQIAMECGPCRVDKAIDYLEIPNTELWILTRKNKSSEHILFKITRGENWFNFLEHHKKYQFNYNKKSIENAFKTA
jgi:hypothetical protein